MVTPEVVEHDPQDPPRRSAGAPGSWARRHVRWLMVLLSLAFIAAAVLGVRTWRTLALLDSAYEAGVPQASSVRPWMTLGYVASTYRVNEAALREHLGVAQSIPSQATLKALARSAGASPPDYARSVQLAIAAAAPVAVSPPAPAASGWLDAAGEDFIAAVVVYGYPALALTLMLGAIGLPLPSGLSMIVAGSLAAQGQMSWPLVAAVATAASVAGDAAGYGVGHVLGGGFLDRRGRWFGLTPERRVRVERLFERWGALGVLLSRSLVSALSSAVNLVAGAGGYRLQTFVALAIVGRALWTSAYLGLGYVSRSGLEPAAGFLASLSGFLVCLALAAGLGLALQRARVPAASPG